MNSKLEVFLTDYIYSLSERTRLERGTIKVGLDWLLYQLGIAKNWTPFRLPFFRRPEETTGKSKTEPEFGEDISFVSKSKNEYLIFVVKDHELDNKNWTKENFDTDLRKAAAPNLHQEGLENVSSVKVILAYNKDENHTGIQLYDRLVSSFNKEIANNINLSFERWNLTRIAKEVEENLLSPDLLPQHLSGQFRYICSQFNDFDYGTKEWRDQLLPNWRDFLKVVLEHPLDERKLRLIPLTLIILNDHRKGSPNSYPAWIDLIEWAMLAVWSCHKKLPDRGAKKLKKAIGQIWINFYIAELEKYLMSIENVMTTQHAFSVNRIGTGFGISPINDAYLAYWHLGRLGILTLAPQDFQLPGKSKKNAEYDIFIRELVKRSSDWIVKCLQLNPAALRPLLDLNHIEIFLIWLILYQAGRIKDIYEWLSELEARLLMRRAKMHISVPFIESNSRMDLLAEYAATGKRPYNYSNNSSYLLLMIIELCVSLPDTQRDDLLTRYMNRIIKGIDEKGQTIVDEGIIDLQSWVPPDNWTDRILDGPVWDGVAITTDNFERLRGKTISLPERIKQFVDEMRQKHPWEIHNNAPLAVYILACIKHSSPLPPEFWRGTVFPRP
jgi:hypothetical protein